MALYYGSTLEPLANGVRVSKTKAMEKGEYQTAFREVVMTGLDLSPLLLGQRYIERSMYNAKKTLGQLLDVHEHQVRQYQMIQSAGFGSRHHQWSDVENLHLAIGDEGGRVNKVLSGASSVGVGYEPSTPSTPTTTPIRRWPRSWHGENMN